MGKELGPLVPFFPEFRKIDTFNSTLKVVDVALGAASCHILAESAENGVKLYAVGDNEWGQHGNGTKLMSHEVVEVKTDLKLKAIAAGAFHIMALSKDDKCYGWGKMN
jgi:alpha-tubulin suppressor-like RCC1 family protein